MARVATTGFRNKETITFNGSTAKGFTGSLCAGMSYAYISLEGAALRWWGNGDAPVTGAAGVGSGHRMEVNQQMEITSLDVIANFQAVPVDSTTTCYLQCEYGT